MIFNSINNQYNCTNILKFLIVCIDDLIVKESLSHYEINPLYRYLCGVFGMEETARLFNLYRIGTSAKWGGATVFWQTDDAGRTRTGKVMLYNPSTGRRVKEPQEQVSPAQMDLLGAAFMLATAGPAQTRVGKGAGGSHSELPWDGKKNSGRRR